MFELGRKKNIITDSLATKDNQRLSEVAPPLPTTYEVKEWYNKINALGQEEDLWHRHSTRALSRYIARRLSRLLPNSLVLNAGSGDGSFELREHKLFHLDLVISSLNAKVGIAGSIEAIGIRDEAIDALICVGSVLNYADPCKAIGEFSRVIKRGGHLILEFERITSGESLRRCKKSSVAYYRGIKHYLCLYSETYVGKLLQDDGFLLDDAKHFHIASNILLKATGYTSLAGVLAVLDPLARLSKPLRSRAGNVILGCVKNGY